MSPIVGEITMRLSCIALLLAGLIASGATETAGQALCKPAITPQSSRHSDVVDRQRRWTGVFVVDALPCASAAGFFTVDFTRLKEIGPDLVFTELFTWQPGRTEVGVDLAWDEWVQAHRIGDVAPCPCRE
jgi:hypothetical protein